MGTKIRLLLGALAFAVPALRPVCADELATPGKSGQILILDNDRTLEGDIDRQKDQYRIRRAVGELWIPAENVVRLCKSKEEAYDFLRSRANLRDPDEHLRLAQWCQARGLKNQAIVEVKEVVALAP